MENYYMRDLTIEEILQNEDSEEEDVSEAEHDEHFSEHESGSEQDGEDVLLPASDVQNMPEWDREDTDDVPLANLRYGRYIGRDNLTQWQVAEPSQRRRTRAHNIITHPPGPVREGKDCDSIAEAWRLIFPDEYIEKVVTYTNIYITGLQVKYSRDRDCKITDLVEIKALFGLLYFTGKLRSAHLNSKDLWAKDGSGMDLCIASMSRKRFHFLLRCLRFDNIHSRQERRSEDKLTAIREIFDDFSTNIKKYYSLGEHVTIDEKLEKTRCRCPFLQYIPSKPGRYGIKIFMLTDARTFYTYNMEVYVGKNEGPYDHSNAAIDVVKRLVEPIRGSHRNVVMDNWFTSYQLLKDLLNDYGLTALGTLRKNKPQIPPLFIVSRNRDVRSSLFGFQEDCTLTSYMPKKGKIVLMASTMHHDAKIDESTGEARKPEMITDYNRHKCGVDVVDELCGTYSVSRVTRRWPLVIFFGIMNMAGINAYVITKANIERQNKVMPPRNDCLKELALYLVMPQIKKRAAVTNLPSFIKAKIQFILGDTHEEQASQAGPSVTMTNISSSRCSVCPWKKDKKTKTGCQLCLKKICREHTVPICDACYQKNRSM